MKRSVYHCLYILLFVLIASCNQQEQTDTQTLNPVFAEEHTIEYDPNMESEQVITPSGIQSDSNGHIFISDSRQQSIFVYDQEGQPLRKIGRPGRGPGEFGSNPLFTLTREGDIVVIDSRNQRIQKFSGNGDLLFTVQPESNFNIWPRKFREVPGDGYLLLRKLSEPRGDANAGERDAHSYILHHFSEAFEQRKDSFSSSDSLIDNHTDFVKLFIEQMNAGSFWIGNNSQVWFAPGIYDGRIYRFAKKENEWEPETILQGKVVAETPFEQLRSNSNDNTAITFHVFSGEGPFSGRINSESMGLFSLSDGRLVHFSNQLEPEEEMRSVFIEVFNKNGILEGIGKLHEFSYSATLTRPPLTVEWVDEQGRFYLIDNREEPAVRIGKIAGI